MVVASLNDSTLRDDYRIGFPREGAWQEIFNSDVYDNYVNPWVVGNGGRINAVQEPLHGLPCSATIVVPANAVLVFRYEGTS